MKRILLSAGILVLSMAPAFAATISVSGFSKSGYNAAVAAVGNTTVENFESFAEGNVSNGFTTNVGSFSKISGTGNGGTVKRADFDNDGSLLAIRDGNVYGRVSTTKSLSGNRAHNKFLDSNDTHGIRWDASIGGGAFRHLILTIADSADTGASLEIMVNGSSYRYARQRNGNKKLIVIDLGEAVTSASIFFTNLKNGNRRVNDGFSLDDVAISAIPLPASALLLLGGLGGLAALKRRKKA